MRPGPPPCYGPQAMDRIGLAVSDSNRSRAAVPACGVPVTVPRAADTVPGPVTAGETGRPGRHCRGGEFESAAGRQA